MGAFDFVIDYIYEDVIKKGIGPDYRQFSSYLFTVFFFILFNNLLGVIPIFPGGANLTGNITITMTLAFCTFVAVNLFGTKKYWKEVFWPETPLFLKVPMPIMPFVEFFRCVDQTVCFDDSFVCEYNGRTYNHFGVDECDIHYRFIRGLD